MSAAQPVRSLADAGSKRMICAGTTSGLTVSGVVSRVAQLASRHAAAKTSDRMAADPILMVIQSAIAGRSSATSRLRTRQKSLRQACPIRGADREIAVVEVVLRVVHHRAAFTFPSLSIDTFRVSRTLNKYGLLLKELNRSELWNHPW